MHCFFFHMEEIYLPSDRKFGDAAYDKYSFRFERVIFVLVFFTKIINYFCENCQFTKPQ